MARKRNRATPPCKDWEPPPGGWKTPNADRAALEEATDDDLSIEDRIHLEVTGHLPKDF